MPASDDPTLGVTTQGTAGRFPMMAMMARGVRADSRRSGRRRATLRHPSASSEELQRV